MPVMSYECRHIMPSGAKCACVALKGKPYCYAHTRLHQFKAAPQIQPMDDLRLPVLEDRTAILSAIAMVTDALCSARIDTKRAGILLYSIQIASQNVDKADVMPFKTVETITQTDTGEELAPEKYICDKHKCAACPERDTCEFCELDEDEEQEEDEHGESKPVPRAVQSARSIVAAAVHRAMAAEGWTIPAVHGAASNAPRPMPNCALCNVSRAPSTGSNSLTTDNLKLTTRN